MAQQTVALLTTEPETERHVAAALAPLGRSAALIVCRGSPELVTRLEEWQPAAALVDIDLQPERILRELDEWTSRFSATRFVVLSRSLENGLVLEAMEAGARHFVVKGSIPADLPGIMQRLAASGPARQGAVVTVLSASGGCGATTLAVNLAGELNLRESSPALVVDMDTVYGAVTTYLGLRGEYGIADVLGRREKIDPEVIKTTALAGAKGVHVLASPASIVPRPEAGLAFERLGDALDACKEAYRYTVVDAPRVPAAVAAVLARSSLATLVVFQLAVKDIRFARGLIASLGEAGVPSDRVIPVANRFRRRGPTITLDEARRALGGAEPYPISNDFPSAVGAINFGQLLHEAASRSPLRRDLASLADRLALEHSSRPRLQTPR
ncbi:MAG: hypothetical protein HY721_10970 [Planctomycetes bacterium]|nr:hypothetical protein [Planctomycetota bacterium]